MISGNLRSVALAVLLSAAAAGAVAQQAAAAIVEYASSDDVTVIRGGRPLPMDDPFGFELMEGDTVQTGRATLLEIRMSSGGAVFKLAENTTFVLARAAQGETKLSLVYGRLRAKVDKLVGNDSFTVVAASATAGVRGTDFGVDVLATKASVPGAPDTSVYCFEGAVQVVALVNTLASSKERLESIPKSFSLGPGQMVSVTKRDDLVEASPAAIAPDIREFWTANEFVEDGPPKASAAPLPAPDPAREARLSEQERMNLYHAGHAEGYAQGAAETEAAFEGFISAAEAERLRLAAANQRGAVLAGALVACAGSGLSIAGYWLSETGSAAEAANFTRAGGIISALSVPFFVLALAIGPR